MQERRVHLLDMDAAAHRFDGVGDLHNLARGGRLRRLCTSKRLL